jgi:hypothetical protein
LSATYNPNPAQPFAQHALGPGSHHYRINDTQDAAEHRTTTDERDFWEKDPRSVLQSRVSGGKGESWVSPRVYQTTDARRAMKGEAVGRARQTLRDTWEEQAAVRGPGHYADNYEHVPFSDQKINTSISRPGPRMKRENKDQSLTPGAGTYGLDGVPSNAFDRTLDKSQPDYSSPTKKGIMANTPRTNGIRGHPGVAPGQYHHEPPVLKSSTGTKGPYELMTGERFNLNKKKDTSLGPGQYPIKQVAPVFPNKEHLSFGKDAQRFPTVPADRFTNTVLAQYPRSIKEPNPTKYNPDKQGIGTKQRMSKKNAPFDRTASRADQRECYKTNSFNGSLARFQIWNGLQLSRMLPVNPTPCCFELNMGVRSNQ